MKARVGLGLFLAGGLLVALFLAFVLSPEASSKPDGLNKVAIDKGFSGTAKAHTLEDTPTAGYEVRGVHDGRLSRGLAGLIGVTVTLALTGGLFAVVRRSGRARAGAPPSGGT